MKTVLARLAAGERLAESEAEAAFGMIMAGEATPAQIALAWVLRQPDFYVIPKAGDVEHMRENHGALDIELTKEDLRELDREFPPPHRKTQLEMI